MATKTVQKKRKATSSDTAATKKARTSKSSTVKSTIQNAQAEAGVQPADLASSPAADEIAFDSEPIDDQDSASEDDQTAALLQGFEDPSSDEAETALSTFDTANLPDPSTALTNSTSSKSLAKNASQDSSAPTVLYLSRIPHGFFEPEMRSYFSQFGTIKHLRLARNRRTGASKHYAFLEFTDPEVASVVQKTMDNYLMFKHILKVKLVPKEKVHESLWKGADRRFRKVPWNRIERTRVTSTDREGWGKRAEREEKRRSDKAEKLKKLGYEFDAPKLRDVATIPVQAIEQAKEAKEIEAAGAEGKTMAAEAIAAVGKPGKVGEPGYAAVVEDSSPAKVKMSKRKAVAVPEDVVGTTADGKRSEAGTDATKKKKSKSGVKAAKAGKQIAAL